MQKKIILILISLVLGFSCKAYGHFLILKPSKDIVTIENSPSIQLSLLFTHPMEGGPSMELKKPLAFGVFIRGHKYNLLNSLKSYKKSIYPSWHREGSSSSQKVTAWQTSYTLKRPGDHIFYVIPQPYFEPSEEKFIQQVTKVVVNAFGAEEGWDQKVNLPAEIIPLSRPYGLWEGNIFRGLVLIKGKPAPYIDVEVEYYNKDGKIQGLPEAFITQVVKTDQNGIFCYSIPWSGWWGFSALGNGGFLKKGNKRYPVELDAVIWIKAYPLPQGTK